MIRGCHAVSANRDSLQERTPKNSLLHTSYFPQREPPSVMGNVNESKEREDRSLAEDSSDTPSPNEEDEKFPDAALVSDVL